MRCASGSAVGLTATLATVVATLSGAGSLAADAGAGWAYYVSVQGNDAWSGTLAEPDAGKTNGPFATLERARDEVRKRRAGGALPTGGVTVYVRGGMYELARPLKLDATDSGTAEAPVVYRAYEQEQPVVIGGRRIGGWQPHQGAIVKADVGAQGLKGVSFRQLFCDGRRQVLARHPNADPKNPVTGGWAYVDGKPVPMYQDIPGESLRTLAYRPGDIHDWAHPEEAEVVVFPRYNWWNNIIRIAAIDREQRVLTLAADASYANRPNDRYYVRNAFEELDAPGEWYLDPRTWTLYFWPPAGSERATVYAPALETLIEITDAAGVTVRGLTMECADGTAVILRNCRDCRVVGNTLRNVGSRASGGESAIAVQGGRHNGVVGNDIGEVGSNAISLDGGDFQTLEPAGHYADNNYLHHVGVFYKQGVGVAVNGVGNRVSHNLIHDCPRFGIVWGGNDHLFEYNHIRHCTLETADTGAIYSWQVDWSKRGTVMRHNYLHDIVGFGQENGAWRYPHMNWGIYLDDGTCGVHVYGNIVARTILGGVHYHGGRDNVVENNILVDGRDSQVQYSGYVKGGHPVPMMTDTWSKFSGTPAYEKYPGYAELTRSLEDAWQMAGNKFLRNIVSYSHPKARLYAHYNLPFDKTENDYNLIWHNGLEVLTGRTGSKGTIGPNLVPNPDFETGTPGDLPADWQWQVRPHDSSAAADAEVFATGKQAVRIEGRGTTTDASGQVLCSNFVSVEFPLVPGRSYRLAARVRAAQPDTAFAIMPQAYRPDGGFFWAKGTDGRVGPEWREVEALFRFPAPGDPDFHEGMEGCVRVRIDVRQGTGTIWVDDVRLHEVIPMSEWEAWQTLGLDRHSQVADPLFVDAARDDYRLRPESPALALGFKPIPVADIGPYADDLRASWPIREAEGAREQMTIDWSGAGPRP